TAQQTATDQLRTSTFVNTRIENNTSRGLTVQLLVFHGKDGETLKDAALQWYLNQVQMHRDKTLFEDWISFADVIKAAFQPPHYQQLLRRQLWDLKQTSTVQEYTSRFRNLLGQIEVMHEANKVMYFTKDLKGAMKAKVNYRASDTLDYAVKLAASFDTAMYSPSKSD
ncbi:341_t:CDS:2, partial [Dentiscutata erythropus]